MFRMRFQTRFITSLLLAVVLIAAQLVVAAHALDHDPAQLQGKVCASCVAASQLGSASIDHAPPPHVGEFTPVFHFTSVRNYDALHLPVVRQRGPPPQI